MVKEQAIFIKGVAIILLLLGHLALVGSVNVYPLSYLGFFAVDLFLFCSGFGLFKSYLKKPELGIGFFAKRAKRIYPPFLLVALPLVLVTVFSGRIISEGIVVAYLSGFDFTRTIDPTMWFISFILLNYLLFFVAFSFKTNNFLKIVIFTIISFFIFYLNYFNIPFGQSAWQFKAHALSFPLGLLIGAMSVNLTITSLVRKLGAASLVIALCLLLPRLANTNVLILAGLVFAMILFLLLDLLPPGITDSKFIALLGDYSYEIYLVEWIIITGLLKLVDDQVIWALFSLAVILVSSLSLRIFVQFILTTGASFRSKKHIT